MHQLATHHGGKCLSTSYRSLQLKLEWQCVKGHIFSLPPQKILVRNYWCAECTGRRTLHTVDSMHKIAKEKGWEFLTSEFTGVMKRHKWRCDKGHTFEAFPHNVIKGSNCRICIGKGLLSIEVFKEIAAKRGGECLSEKYINDVKLKFRCSNNHIFEANADDVKYGNNWCKKCAGLERGTIEEMKLLAEKRGGKCLSKEYLNSATRLTWQCKDGHHWNATPRDVKHSDSWCPYCTWYKNEERCRYILNKLLKTEFVKTRRIIKGLELDGYTAEHSLAFEYHGEQHFNDIHFFSRDTTKFQKQKLNNEKKIRECKSKGISLLIIPFDKAKSNEELVSFICESLNQFGFHISHKIENDFMDDFYKSNSTIDGLRKIFEARGGTLLSNEYFNNQTKLKVVCRNGHKWATTSPSLKANHWCLKCRTPKVKFNIVDMIGLAKGRGGECLSEKYINCMTKLLWRCSLGHEWLAKPNDVRHKNSWCPKCSRKIKQ